MFTDQRRSYNKNNLQKFKNDVPKGSNENSSFHNFSMPFFLRICSPVDVINCNKIK